MPPPGVCLNIMEARHKQDGYGSITNPERFLQQDYQQLKEYCSIKLVRYIDDMFPWLRPAKIAPDPSFVLDGVSRFDFGQGIISNCWFLASIGALTFQNHILEQVVPLEQTFDEDNRGLFHFRLLQYEV